MNGRKSKRIRAAAAAQVRITPAPAVRITPAPAVRITPPANASKPGRVSLPGKQAES